MKPKPPKKSPGKKTGESLIPAQQPMVAFASAAAFSEWLGRHHASHPGIWLRIYKKGTERPSVTYAEALDVALCLGWIDGQKQPGDEASWLQRFTRRRPRSGWSKINVAHVERLSRAGRMQPAGVAAVEAAKADGRWASAYSSSIAVEMPADFMQALAKFPKAEAFFNTLSKGNRYAIYYRLHTAKRPETRTRRLNEFLAMLARGEKLH